MKGKKLKMKLFYEEELRKKSYYEMYQIAIEENLVNGNSYKGGINRSFDEI